MAGAAGIVLTILSDVAAAVYAAVGFLVLWLAQFKVIRRSSLGWRVFGGNPFLKLAADEMSLAKLGLALLVPVVLTLLVKVLWMSYGG